MLNKIKEFLSCFLPLPYRRAVQQDKALALKIEDIKQILEKSNVSFEKDSKSLETHLQFIKMNAEETNQQLVSKLQNIEKQVSELLTGLQSVKAGTVQQTNKMAADLRSIETKMLRVQQQPRLSYFALGILDHCNLNCKGCDVFSSIAEERFVSLKDIQNDLRQISLLTRGDVTRINILGGEPLLHPDLLEILRIARETFPKTLLQVVSNGLLLLNKKDDFWSICRENDIVVVVTKYPINIDHSTMLEVAKSNQVKFHFYGNTDTITKTSYKMPMDIDGLQDARRSFWNCYHVNTCPILKEGKLYPCSPSSGAIHFNRRFGTHMDMEADDYLDIYSVKDNAELLSFLSTPKPFCRFCKTAERTFGHTWEQSKKDISEWT